VNSLAKACEKRSISLVTLESAVDEIVHELETSGREVTSAAIGTKVLEKLRAIDEVAYLRYASVHQRFNQVGEFVDAIQALGRRIKPNALQRELFPPELAQPEMHSASAGPASNEKKAKAHGRV
jgi:transcriptional repressor NrdR